MSGRSGQLDQELAAELHAELISEYAKETEEWATERLRRVMKQLNGVRKGRTALTAHVLWIREFNAFTTPAPHIYVGRRLLERLPTDDSAAFVLAHEAAHHDCGHLDLFTGWLEKLPRGHSAALAASFFRLFEHRLYGPERESEADRYAIDLCVRAGFDGDKCLRAFDILEQGALDRRDIDAVYGPESLLDPTDPGFGSALFAAQRWLWNRARRYLPLRERRDDARAWLHRPGRR